MTGAGPAAHVPSASQRAAIEAPPGPILVLAGPGAGKTFCLIERIGFLVEHLGMDPARICAFTFTNKAADEIAARLEHRLRSRAEEVKRGTLHAFCSALLREFGEHVGLQPGFGIADEEDQRAVLQRLNVPSRLHRSVLNAFPLYRFRHEPIGTKYEGWYKQYVTYMENRNVLDFDTLVLKAAELVDLGDVAAQIRGRWDCVLVDEFQDLNPAQYKIVRALASEHRHIFAVGDDEQSIYTWAGADPAVFNQFINDFGITTPVYLAENHRCPREVFALARRLVMVNTPIFANRASQKAERESQFPIQALTFGDERAEIAWISEDLRRDRESHALEWGDFALLYRTHAIGAAIEGAFLAAGIPCRLAHGRAFAEDRIVAYVIAALRVIANPGDDIHREHFLRVVLPNRLCDDARAQAEAKGRTLLEELEEVKRARPKNDADGRKIRRAFYTLENLAALGRKHTNLTALVEELLAQGAGEYRTVLEKHYEELSDPAQHREAVALAERLRSALEERRVVWLPRHGGVEIALKGLLLGLGVLDVQLGGECHPEMVAILPEDAPGLGLALALFKAAQLVSTASYTNAFRDFTAVDLETTDKDVANAEIVEVAAVRVRDGKLVDEFHTLVRPRVPIAGGAFKQHGISEEDVASAPFFEDVWPRLKTFFGNDILVAHNGYEFDFPILRRMMKALGDDTTLYTYDTLPLAKELHPTSRALPHLARVYGVDPGESHRALDDTRTLAAVFIGLGDTKVRRARTTALAHLLDHLGVALALTDLESLSVLVREEAVLLRRLSARVALRGYSDCLDFYELERQRPEAELHPTLRDLIEQLGGEELMQKIRAEKSVDEWYPGPMRRMRRLIDVCAEGPLPHQISSFLERAVLSMRDNQEPERQRVSLLTLHSTKGLEFSRVYVVGVEDAQLPGGSPTKGATKREIEEARRLLYVGMTRVRERLVLTRVEVRGGRPSGGHQFLDDMVIAPRPPTTAVSS